MTANWHHGNTTSDTQATRGWLLGSFIEPDNDVRFTKQVEVKWGIHSAGDKRSGWTSDDRRTTLLLLVEGAFRIDLTEGSRVLAKQGDYTLWGPGIDHSWEALSDSVVVTVRWPSTS
jgi:hypothetical protein